MTQAYDIIVTYNSGAYVTRTVRGERASSTMSAQAAAIRLGDKLFPQTLLGADLLPRQAGDGAQTTRWRLTASTEG